MKQTLGIVLFTILSCIFSCTKKDISDSGKPGGGGGGTTPVGTTSPCTTQLSDADTVTLFPADNAWNQDISGAAVDSLSTEILAAYSGTGVKADFGSGLYQGEPIGIPFVVVCASQPKIQVVFRGNSYDADYGDQSDPGPYPIPLDAPIEGGGQGGDSHVIALDRDNGILYELYNAGVNGDHWEASSGAVFNLHSDALRPDGWTSADAAGLPIFPGLVRYDEVLNGAIDHPIRFTLTKAHVQEGYIAPARHEVNSTGGTNSLPFGARIRLQAGYDISGFSVHNQVMLKAMKKYGLILADIGSDMYISGAPDDRWDNDELRQLLTVTASNFEVVKFNH